jgi:hypothetical protein
MMSMQLTTNQQYIPPKFGGSPCSTEVTFAIILLIPQIFQLLG